MPLEGQFLWPSISGGFTLSFWIKANFHHIEIFCGPECKIKDFSFEENVKFSNFHILSIGSPKALFEIWTNNNKSLILRY